MSKDSLIEGIIIAGAGGIIAAIFIPVLFISRKELGIGLIDLRLKNGYRRIQWGTGIK